MTVSFAEGRRKSLLLHQKHCTECKTGVICQRGLDLLNGKSVSIPHENPVMPVNKGIPLKVEESPIQKFRRIHTRCNILVTKTGEFPMTEVILACNSSETCEDTGGRIFTNVPYPFCTNYKKCAGEGYCKRDIACDN